jgi:hypothetical protein
MIPLLMVLIFIFYINKNFKYIKYFYSIYILNMEPNNIYKKPENKFKPGELSINKNDNIPTLKDPIKLDKKNNELKKKEKIEKEKINKAKKKNELLEKYRALKKKTFRTEDEKEKDEKDEIKTTQKKLVKEFIKILRTEKKNKIKKKRDPFILLMQTKGKLNPENLINLEKYTPDIKYKVDLDNYDDDSDEDEDEDEKKINEVTKSEDNIGVRIHKNRNLTGKNSIWAHKLKHRLKLLKLTSDIPEKYHTLIGLLQISVPKFYKYEKLFDAIKELASELNKEAEREGKPPSSEPIRDAIIVFIMRYFMNHNIAFSSFKNDLLNYYNLIKNNINTNINEKKKISHFGIFIIMYETFIKNDFWMMFPIENKHFLTYIIERIYQTIDEGIDTVVENYTTDEDRFYALKKEIEMETSEERELRLAKEGKNNKLTVEEELKEMKKETYNIIENDGEMNKFKQKKFLKIIQKETDKHPFIYHKKMRKIWEEEKTNENSNNKRLFIYAAARQGIVQYILLTTLSILPHKIFPQITFYNYRKNQSKTSTLLINYLDKNLSTITHFLNTQINIITNDSNISNSDKQNKFFKYLWKEYEMLLDL